jgi:hypothetical protein
MQQEIQAGTVLMKESHLFVLESEPYFGNWSVVRAFEDYPFDQQVHAAGCHFPFIGAEVKVRFLGELGTKKINKAFTQILRKMRGHNFNCIKVTGIIVKRFLGVSYTTVSAHSRYLQQKA